MDGGLESFPLSNVICAPSNRLHHGTAQSYYRNIINVIFILLFYLHQHIQIYCFVLLRILLEYNYIQDGREISVILLTVIGEG